MIQLKIGMRRKRRGRMTMMTMMAIRIMSNIKKQIVLLEAKVLGKIYEKGVQQLHNTKPILTTLEEVHVHQIQLVDNVCNLL